MVRRVGQHQRVPPRRPDLAVTERSLPYELTLSSTPSPTTSGPAPGRHERPPQVRPEDRRDARDGLRLRRPVPLHVIDSCGELVRTVEMASGPIMVHDMGLTDSRVVPSTCRGLRPGARPPGRPFPFRWRPYNGRVGLLPRAGTRRHGVDRRRALLHLPPPQRLRRRGTGRHRPRGLRPCSTSTSSPGPIAPGWSAGPSIRGHARSSPRRSTIGPGVPAGGRTSHAAATGTATRWAILVRGLGGIGDEPTAVLKHDFVAGHRRGPPRLRPHRQRDRVRPGGARPARTTVGSWATCTTPRATPATW